MLNIMAEKLCWLSIASLFLDLPALALDFSPTSFNLLLAKCIVISFEKLDAL